MESTSDGDAFQQMEQPHDNQRRRSHPLDASDLVISTKNVAGQMDDEQHSDLVRLNVGGLFYMTSIETLQREPRSLFTEIFTIDGLKTNRSKVRRFTNGTYFIDRDGELFAYVLDYLRTGKLLLPEGFRELARLREEVDFYRLEALMQQLMPYYNLKYPLKQTISSNTTNAADGANGGTSASTTGATDNKLQTPGTTPTTVVINPLYETGGFITLSYRGTFAWGRDGQSDIKFRKLNRILICGKIALCREVFGETLNESRDPDREGTERYTSRLYLKHQACDSLAEKGFKLITSCSSGANGLASIASQSAAAQVRIKLKAVNSSEDIMNSRNSGDLEEQRWAHYTEFVFYREPQFNLFNASPFSTPRNSTAAAFVRANKNI